MKKNACEIAVVLDRSGSMSTIRKDMEGGFDHLIAEQRKVPGECRVSLYQFDDRYEVVYEGKALAEVPPLHLSPRGNTALLDAVGKTIASFGERLAQMPATTRPERVLFVIITDGEENYSKEYTRARVREMVKHQEDKYAWQFAYLGASANAFAEAESMGIASSSNFVASSAGTKRMVEELTSGILRYRSGGGYQAPKKIGE